MKVLLIFSLWYMAHALLAGGVEQWLGHCVVVIQNFLEVLSLEKICQIY